MTKVVIIGAGFGGLNVTQALKKASVEILVLDRNNYHLFQPLLYQIATAVLSVSNIAAPIREVLKKQKNVTVFMEEVTRIDKVEQKVYTMGGEVFDYDFLVVAPGARTLILGMKSGNYLHRD